MFGEFCSTACLEAVQAQTEVSDPVKKRAAQTGAEHGIIIRTVKRVLLGIVGIILVGILFFLWTAWLYPYGKLKWTVDNPGGAGRTQFVKATESFMLARIGSQLVAINPKEGAAAWSQNLEGGETRYLKEDESGLLVGGEHKLQRLATGGDVLWSQEINNNKRPREVLCHSQDLALVKETVIKEYERRDLYERMEVKIDRLMERQLNESPTVIRQQYLLTAISMKSGKELWVAQVPNGLTLGAAAIDSQLAVTGFTWFEKQRTQIRIIAFKPSSGERLWQINLGDQPVWGPVIEGGYVTYLDEARLHYIDFDGNPKRSLAWNSEEMGMPDDARAETMLRVAYETEELRKGYFWETQYLRLIDSKSGNVVWQFALPGGITSHMSDENRVYLIGHSTEEGGMLDVETMAAGVELMGLEGRPLAAQTATAASVNDWVFLALDLKTGEKVWEEKQISGKVVCGNGRLVVLQDTLETSMRTRTSGEAGVLVIHQFDPTKGKKLYSRKHDKVALGDARIIGKQLVAFAFERSGKVLEGGQPGGNCLGVAGITLK